MNPFEPRRAPSEDDVMMEDEAEAQRDALLFGQQVEPQRRKTSKQPETSKLAGFASAARAAAITGAVVLAALSLSVAFYYRTDLTAANLLRVGVGDAKNAPATSAAVAAVAPAAGTTMPPPLMTASAADATTTTTPLVPPLKAAAPGASSGLAQAGLKTPVTAPGAYIAPPAATTAADVTTTATTSTATTSTTTTASASSGKTKAVKDSRLALLPDIDDPEGLHNYVLANYYLYHGLLGEQGSSKVRMVTLDALDVVVVLVGSYGVSPTVPNDTHISGDETLLTADVFCLWGTGGVAESDELRGQGAGDGEGRPRGPPHRGVRRATLVRAGTRTDDGVLAQRMLRL